jgi:hypothetical protein
MPSHFVKDLIKHNEPQLKSMFSKRLAYLSTHNDRSVKEVVKNRQYSTDEAYNYLDQILTSRLSAERHQVKEGELRPFLNRRREVRRTFESQASPLLHQFVSKHFGEKTNNDNRQTSKQTGSSNVKIDRLYSAKYPGKRVSSSGSVYYEYRFNRSDVNKKNRL